MRRIQWWHLAGGVGLIVAMIGGGAAWAEESAAASADPSTALGAGPSAAAPEAPAAPVSAPVAPAAPAPAAPAAPDLKPIVIKFSGEIVQVNRQDAEHPVVTVRDRYGVTKEMAADANTVETTKTGDQVTVEYTYDVATGKRQVQGLTVTQAAAAPAATQ